jgi:hypothetical protein
LHRQGEIGSLEKDYVVMVMAAQKFNDPGSSEKIKKVIEILGSKPTSSRARSLSFSISRQIQTWQPV